MVGNFDWCCRECSAGPVLLGIQPSSDRFVHRHTSPYPDNSSHQIIKIPQYRQNSEPTNKSNRHTVTKAFWVHDISNAKPRKLTKCHKSLHDLMHFTCELKRCFLKHHHYKFCPCCDYCEHYCDCTSPMTHSTQRHGYTNYIKWLTDIWATCIGQLGNTPLIGWQVLVYIYTGGQHYTCVVHVMAITFVLIPHALIIHYPVYSWFSNVTGDNIIWNIQQVLH